MDRTNFFNGQRVTSDDLNAIDATKATALKQSLAAVLAKFTHRYTGSIPADFRQSVEDASLSLTTFRGVAGGLASNYLTPASSAADTITVQRGWGVTDDLNVVIVPATVTVTKDDDTVNAQWISAATSTMYVLAEYMETSSSIGVTPTGATAYTRYSGSYKIRVTSVYPNTSQSIPLAQFTSDGSGLVSAGTFSDVREYIRSNAADTSVGLTGTAVYTGQNTLYNHIHALGTGTPAATNPHGTSLSDIGYVDSVGIHRRDSHVTGIIITSESYLASSYLGSLNHIGDEYISFYAPAGAALSVNGLIVTGAIPLPLYSSTATGGTGDYWVVVNSSLVASFLSTAASGSLTPFDPHFPQVSSQSVLLGLATTVNPVAKTIASFADYRTFHAMAQPIIRADTTEGTADVTGSLLRNASLQDNMDRIRHQIGVAMTGTGSVWNSATSPLTAGSSSVADAYHTHTTLAATTAIRKGYGIAPDGTVLQNTFGKHIFVQWPLAVYAKDTSSQHLINLYVGATNPPTGSVSVVGVPAGYGAAAESWIEGTLSGIVPPNYYFMASQSSGMGTFGTSYNAVYTATVLPF